MLVSIKARKTGKIGILCCYRALPIDRNCHLTKCVLVSKGARGNEQLKIGKRYHVNGAEAARALNRGLKNDVYWSIMQVSKHCCFWANFHLG